MGNNKAAVKASLRVRNSAHILRLLRSCQLSVHRTAVQSLSSQIADICVCVTILLHQLIEIPPRYLYVS